MSFTIKQIIGHLETIAPPALQESWDNSGLLTGNAENYCSGIVVTLDITEEVVAEAVRNKCNLIVAHHPVIFKGLKKLTGSTHIERVVIAAIRADVALFAIHTNLDNRLDGVSGKMGAKLDLLDMQVLQPRPETIKKLYTYVPQSHFETVQSALFNAGAGAIGNYSECSFSVVGEGTYKGDVTTNPFLATPGVRHTEPEQKLEVVFDAWNEGIVLKSLFASHPYEEVAYEVLQLQNKHPQHGAGVIGVLPDAMDEMAFLQHLKQSFRLELIRHTPLLGKKIKKVALCGGAGSFLISKALSVGADIYITGDIKYHEFFDAESRLVVADIGHFESEQFTIELLYDILLKKFPNFAVLKSGILTNPVQYFK